MMTDEMLLLDLLNTTPVRNGAPGDDLADARAARAWLAGHGQPATDVEHRTLVQTIDKAVKRGAIHRNNGARKKSRAARLRRGPAGE